MSQWEIELQGDESDISLLQTLLSNTDYSIESDVPFNRLPLLGVPEDADSETIHSAADQLIEVVNGAGKLYYDGFEGVTFTKVTIEESDGTRRDYGYLTAAPRETTFTAVSPYDATLATWVTKGLEDPEVSRALSLFGALQPNWKNLYLVLEVIEDDIGGEAALKESGLVDSKALDSFKHTANSYQAIGKDARHATLSREPPSEPMSIREAGQFIRTLMRKWIASKDDRSA